MTRTSAPFADLGYSPSDTPRRQRGAASAPTPVMHEKGPGDRSPAAAALRRMRAAMPNAPETPATAPRRAGKGAATQAIIEADRAAAIAAVRLEFWQVWCGVHPTKTSIAEVGLEYRGRS